jgi:hypothetical protein
MSNNGDGEPIGYERDFAMTVGTVVTTTTTITATITQVSTPVVNATGELYFSVDIGTCLIRVVTITDIIPTTLPTVTTTVPSVVCFFHPHQGIIRLTRYNCRPKIRPEPSYLLALL